MVIFYYLQYIYVNKDFKINKTCGVQDMTEQESLWLKRTSVKFTQKGKPL